MTTSLGDEATSHMAISPSGTDGALDRVLRYSQKRRCIPAIFVHAGAGFHSQQNEKVHLQACISAVEMGMKFLKSGATATEAVEAALRVLEDEEITNAGYGSNLCIDGTVECDATLVDHFGRSGACSAVPNVRNPISLAKLILDKSSQPLSLRRVPPNILVGEGARMFAEEHGIPTFPNEALVSKGSRNRFLRWREDLLLAQEKERSSRSPPSSSLRAGIQCSPCQYDNSPSSSEALKPIPRHHAIIAATTNMAGTSSNADQPDHPSVASPSSNDGVNIDRISHSHIATYGKKSSRSIRSSMSPATLGTNQSSARGYKRQFAHMVDSNNNDSQISKLDSSTPDNITDTIGAIAIDENGLIAAGSSSGGIGMKHRGRLGPAALVGVGTAIIPEFENEEGLTVAAVTSGTGEHMATTMASQRCAERLYYGTRKGPAGTLVEDSDDSIMESFILDDFMDHPGVKNCASVGALGVMAVKKCRGGYYFYFAHNTDSFALASMGGAEKRPSCVMSRLPGGGKVTSGGRKISID